MKEGPLAVSWVPPKDHNRMGQNDEYQRDENRILAASATMETPISKFPGVLDIHILMKIFFCSISPVGHPFLLRSVFPWTSQSPPTALPAHPWSPSLTPLPPFSMKMAPPIVPSSTQPTPTPIPGNAANCTARQVIPSPRIPSLVLLPEITAIKQ